MVHKNLFSSIKIVIILNTPNAEGMLLESLLLLLFHGIFSLVLSPLNVCDVSFMISLQLLLLFPLSSRFYPHLLTMSSFMRPPEGHPAIPGDQPPIPHDS